MPGLWERLRRLITLKRQGRKGPLQALEEYHQRLFRSADQLTWQYLKLGKVSRQLGQRAESLRRLIQRYDDQARKHYKLNQLDLAEAAIREKLKHQADLKRLEGTVEELGERLKTLKAYKEKLAGQLQLYQIHKEALELRYDASRTELEARELQSGLSLDELPDLKGAIEEAEEEIRVIQAQLEATRELEEADRRSEGEEELRDEEVAREIAELEEKLHSKGDRGRRGRG